MSGVGWAAANTFVLVLFIGGVWCLAATKRKGLGLGLMALPFLLNVAGIWVHVAGLWGGYIAEGDEFLTLAGMMH
jgi:hypothetical protein